MINKNNKVKCKVCNKIIVMPINAQSASCCGQSVEESSIVNEKWGMLDYEQVKYNAQLQQQNRNWFGGTDYFGLYLNNIKESK